MNKLFVAYKPTQISSNAFLQKLKKKYKCDKAGYSGTLDPFAKGVLIIAFGQFTKVLRFLQKSPKTYRATLWLGAHSLSLDDKNIIAISKLPTLDCKKLEQIKNELVGELVYFPPQFSAKKIQGRRAYELAKRGEYAELKPCKMQIFSCEIRQYIHPFLSLELCVSEGSYIRSYCELFASKLGIKASLSSLERLSEGQFRYENEKELKILDFLAIKQNFIYETTKLENGLKLDKADFQIQTNGIYFIVNTDYFSIIEIKNAEVFYLLNKIKF
ncbi:tRNA pseudouridine(55) synthase TruB [Campylobacter sp. MIT 21-1685]|uniref:tRNA pseudouridine(55) synthase TruB n=1 Tax=unclassified Campylobacter TaxID=2593542 RepID=UPI00224A9760|nr:MULTISPECIES: tRNA pseudouridine(55) synthase TruB [unclassified Campylobacter]MCX2682418.1 tRNA pseudouridine(55) synthase TruB [Campylobacter sp. MIT 21-1684]MCX2750698.1 tRNA pseudouridine(55) synthase TruB [Campylobacter sp. MIT 21-1682]MCX2806754.1 tRNA pseudouridine(55) synthase TruB [Campylobacter sp. MIT 21-1685]